MLCTPHFQNRGAYLAGYPSVMQTAEAVSLWYASSYIGASNHIQKCVPNFRFELPRAKAVRAICSTLLFRFWSDSAK